jgi:DNA-binding CsgD family transcriptional regulator
VELLERDKEWAVLDAALHASRTVGRVIVVAGEAGIGKTALVAAACAAAAPRRALWGACDPLITPRPLGPLWDVAREVGGPLLAALTDAAPREELLARMLEELAAGGSSMLVVEDLHWSDDATLDLVALLARRIVHGRGCLILTCRDDGLGERPELRRLLAALPRDGTARLEPAPLSERAVALLAARARRAPADLHTLTGGNPFFVTEALAAPDGAVPGSVRDAVAARVAALGEDARAVVELVAVIPGAMEPGLLAETVGAGAAAIDACIAAGILVLHEDALAFRHDLARRAVEDGIAPLRRRHLHALVLGALETAGHADPARLVHHARSAGDRRAIRRLAPVAARGAAAAGGHRQALEQWEAALAACDDGPAAERAEALEGVAIEAYLCGRHERALAARRDLLALHERAGDARRAGDDLRWLSRILWWTGEGQEAEQTGDRAIAALEAFPDSRELALALSGRSQLAMLAARDADAVVLGERAVALGRRIGDRETVAHGLTNVGTALIGTADHDRGRALLEEAHALALAAGLDDHAARALVNLGTATLMRRRDLVGAAADLDRALAFVRSRDLDGYTQYVLGVRANLFVLRGAWPAAEADARASLALGEQPGVSLCPALIALGRLQARRGEREAQATLEEAWGRALLAGELQRLAPTAAARAERAWLDGDLEGCAAAVDDAYAVATAHPNPWSLGELAFWRSRAGRLQEPPSAVAEPFARSLAGDWRGAAAAWTAAGMPYEAADARCDANEPDAWLAALAAFDELGAARAASRLRRKLRGAGVRRIPRGPRAATRDGLAGLTPRQVDVVRLMAAGATNAEIAERLVITPKTVDHHVSAVLSRLGLASRREAAAALARLDPQDGEQLPM